MAKPQKKGMPIRTSRRKVRCSAPIPDLASDESRSAQCRSRTTQHRGNCGGPKPSESAEMKADRRDSDKRREDHKCSIAARHVTLRFDKLLSQRSIFVFSVLRTMASRWSGSDVQPQCCRGESENCPQDEQQRAGSQSLVKPVPYRRGHDQFQGNSRNPRRPLRGQRKR